jgi:hypothetical protein
LAASGSSGRWDAASLIASRSPKLARVNYLSSHRYLVQCRCATVANCGNSPFAGSPDIAGGHWDRRGVTRGGLAVHPTVPGTRRCRVAETEMPTKVSWPLRASRALYLSFGTRCIRLKGRCHDVHGRSLVARCGAGGGSTTKTSTNPTVREWANSPERAALRKGRQKFGWTLLALDEPEHARLRRMVRSRLSLRGVGQRRSTAASHRMAVWPRC